MHRGRRLLACLALGLPAPVGAGAAEPCPDGQIRVESGCATLEAAAEGARVIVAQAFADEGMSAAILRLSVGGRPLVTEAWGSSMTGVPATPDMHFRAGAVAIAYLGTVLLQLQERGLLSIEDRLSKWFPDFPGAGEVTLAMLASNTSGYADYVDLEVLPLYENVFRQWQPEELVAIAFGKPTACAPGACFAYAHTNYVVLGMVLEKATGRSVAELIRDGVLAPLGLNDTRSADTAVIQPPVLHSYSDERGLFEDATYWSPSWTLARGAIMTTDIYDLERSAVAVGTGAVLTEASHAAMIEPRSAGLAPLTTELYYGLGVVVNNGWILQNPSFYGYSAVMAYQPANGVAIAVAATMGETTPDRPNERLFTRLGAYLAPEAPPRTRPE